MTGVADRAPPVWTDAAAQAALPCRRGAARVEVALAEAQRVIDGDPFVQEGPLRECWLKQWTPER
jgi:hypothetical protein